jgi:hypothetical protein
VLKKFQEIISNAAAVSGPVDEELRKLLVDRRDAGMLGAGATRAAYEDGRITVDKYYDSIAQALSAQLELSDDPADHVRILELKVDLAKQIENNQLVLLVSGRGSPPEAVEARYKVLNAEIDLLRAKKKLAKK